MEFWCRAVQWLDLVCRSKSYEELHVGDSKQHGTTRSQCQRSMPAALQLHQEFRLQRRRRRVLVRNLTFSFSLNVSCSHVLCHVATVPQPHSAFFSSRSEPHFDKYLVWDAISQLDHSLVGEGQEYGLVLVFKFSLGGHLQGGAYDISRVISSFSWIPGMD